MGEGGREGGRGEEREGGRREGRREGRGKEGGEREGGRGEGGREGGREEVHDYTQIILKCINFFVCQTPNGVYSAIFLPLISNYPLAGE